jgi:hypothetical protein
MGLKATGGEVVRWVSRVRLARNFRGLQVDDFSEVTLQGYNAFFRVFLTHSALELYLPIVGMTNADVITALQPYNPELPIKQFFALDRSGRLFEFLRSRLNTKLQASLTAAREGTSSDVTCLAASVRHIFVHGHLAAHSNDIKPKQISRACEIVSDFLLDFMDSDFTRRIVEYYDRVRRLETEKEESAKAVREPGAEANPRPPRHR